LITGPNSLSSYFKGIQWVRITPKIRDTKIPDKQFRNPSQLQNFVYKAQQSCPSKLNPDKKYGGKQQWPQANMAPW